MLVRITFTSVFDINMEESRSKSSGTIGMVESGRVTRPGQRVVGTTDCRTSSENQTAFLC